MSTHSSNPVDSPFTGLNVKRGVEFTKKSSARVIQVSMFNQSIYDAGAKTIVQYIRVQSHLHTAIATDSVVKDLVKGFEHEL